MAALAKAKAEIETLRAHKAALEADLGKVKDAKRSEAKAADEARKANGEYKALAESYEAQIKDLSTKLEATAGLAEKAKRFDDLVAKEEKLVAERAKSLTDAQRKLIDAIPDPLLRRGVLDELLAAKGGDKVDESTTTTKPNEKDPSGPGPAASSTTKKYTDMTWAERQEFQKQATSTAPRNSMRDIYGV